MKYAPNVSSPSKYPEILIDKERNSPLLANKILSLEEYYDLLHHSHDMSTLTMPSSGNHANQDMAATIEDLYQLIGNLNTTIASLTSRIEVLERYVDNDLQFISN